MKAFKTISTEGSQQRVKKKKERKKERKPDGLLVVFALTSLCSLKVPEKFEKWLRVSSSVKGKPLSTPPCGRE